MEKVEVIRLAADPKRPTRVHGQDFEFAEDLREPRYVGTTAVLVEIIPNDYAKPDRFF
jgi:hypothetical protein